MARLLALALVQIEEERYERVGNIIIKDNWRGLLPGGGTSAET